MGTDGGGDVNVDVGIGVDVGAGVGIGGVSIGRLLVSAVRIVVCVQAVPFVPMVSVLLVVVWPPTPSPLVCRVFGLWG